MTVSPTTSLLSTLDRIRTECLTTVSYSDASRTLRMELLVAAEHARYMLAGGATVTRNPDGSTIIHVPHNAPIAITPRAMLCSCGFDGICGHRLIAANAEPIDDDLPTDAPGYDDENGTPHAAVTLSLAELLAGYCPACEADILGGQHCTCAADDAHVDWMIGRAMAEQEGRVW